MPRQSDEEIAIKYLIGARIAERRHAEGMTQTALAHAVGRTQVVVSGWENGQRRPGFTDIWPLARALRCTVNDLIGPPCTKKEIRDFSERVERIAAGKKSVTRPTNSTRRRDR